MAAINDLIAQIENPELRARIQSELDRMNKQKKFGLVFEEHLPESVKLFDVPVKKNSVVMEKAGGKTVYKVLSINDGITECIDTASQESKTFNISELVSIAQFGTPIYPYLKPIDSICNAPDSDLWHTLIEADNYHALQLLEYLYAGKVDCIYIDPPYNTGARDWKYNNDYVDGADEYRHSKWLSFMQRRLVLAKKLLNPKDSVLIITIDEKEYLHLGCLLEQMFPDARMQMVSSVINPQGSMRKNQFTRIDEYIYFIEIGESCPQALDLNPDFRRAKSGAYSGIQFQPLAKTQYSRKKHPGTFYPIYLNEEKTRIVEIGDPIDPNASIESIPPKPGCVTVWPINKKTGTEAQWSLSPDKLRANWRKGYVRVSKNGSGGLSYLTSGSILDIESGKYPVLGYDPQDGSIIIDDKAVAYQFVPGTAWSIGSHDATRYGTNLITEILQEKRFSFPKSLYAVHDAIRFYVANKPNALILDFFAGSGTTLHAVNLMNAEDEGHRRCIMVTNNEVSQDESKSLKAKGFSPGDVEWEKYGIAHYVTWARTTCCIKGVDINGKPLKGNYIGSDIPMAAGFKTNAVFFKLGFLNKNAVALGRQFRELLPVLWMKAGAIGKCPELKSDNLPDWLIFPENKMAVLIDDNQYFAFKQEIEKISGIETLYIITDFEREYAIMANELGIPNTFQLYRDYLDNFRINHSR